MCWLMTCKNKDIVNKEPRALSKRFGLPILPENQNVPTGWRSLKMFSWIIVVLDLDIFFLDDLYLG